jgi:hypothetical protein
MVIRITSPLAFTLLMMIQNTNASGLRLATHALQQLTDDDSIEFYKEEVQHGYLSIKEWTAALFQSIDDDGDEYEYEYAGDAAGDDDDDDDPRERGSTGDKFIRIEPRYRREK